jgi:rhomboid protease GluP
MNIDKKALLELKLVHYFMTKENFIPIIIHGIEDEIWLENKRSDYRIIRIVTKKIINEEQYEFDIDKTKEIASQIKRKTFNPFMSILNIYLNIDDDVKEYVTSTRNNVSIILNDEKDLEENDIIKKSYKNIVNDIDYKEEGFELLAKITSDLTKKNIEENERFNNMFKQKKPIITAIIVAINIIMFALMYLLGKGSEDSDTLVKFGANVPALIRGGEYFRLLASGFLHIGIIHILCNMYSLVVLGPTIEHFYGKLKYILIYLISMIIASLFVMVFQSDYSVSAGASGAIFGLLGSLLYFGYYYRGYMGNQVIGQIIPVIIINLVIGFISPGISNAAHIGGLIGGIAVSFMLGINDKEDKKSRITGTIITIVLTAFMIYLAFFK